MGYLNCGAIKFLMGRMTGVHKALLIRCISTATTILAAPSYMRVEIVIVKFLANMKKYNWAFQMINFGCNEITKDGFSPSFRVQGKLYHLIGRVVPAAGESSKFLWVEA